MLWSMLIFALVGLVGLPAVAAEGEVHPGDVAGDAILEDLSAGRAAAAERALRAALRQAESDGDRAQDAAALRCVLGHLLLVEGDPAGAVAVLEPVPVSATCGPRAAFERADALEALGQGDAAVALYSELGAQRLGPERDAQVATRILRLVDRVEADGLEANPTRLVGLYALALDLAVAPADRAALARRAAQAHLDMRAVGVGQALRDPVVSALEDALRQGDLSEDEQAVHRLLLAEVLGGRRGLLVLDRVAPGAARDRVEALLRAPTEPLAAVALFERALEQRPNDHALRRRLVDHLRSPSLAALKARHLAVLAAREGGADDALELASLQRALHTNPVAGFDAQVAALRSWLTAFPTDPRRGEVEGRLEEAALNAARAAAAEARGGAEVADALSRLQGFVVEFPGTSAQRRTAALRLQAELAADSGDRARARAIYEQLLTRGGAQAGVLDALFELRAQVQGAEAAMRWLQELEEEGGPLRGAAASVLADRQAPRLRLEAGVQPNEHGVFEVDERASVPVSLHLRNVSAVSLRLHRIDPEAFVRAGGRASTLSSLDVAVIAPDREWTVALDGGEEGTDRVEPLPVSLPGPGLYALTAATDTASAQVVLRAGDARVMAHRVGESLAVGVVRGDRAASGARVLVRTADRVQSARTNREGVAWFDVGGDSVVVLTDGPGGPALADVGAAAPSRSLGRQWSADLDRPAYLPGDTVDARLVVREDGAPQPGVAWVWLRAGGVNGSAVRVPLDARGVGLASVSLPGVSTGALGDVALMARLDGTEEDVRVSSVRVADEADPSARRLSLRREDGAVIVRVEDIFGAPVPGARVEVRRGRRPVEHLTVGPDGERALADDGLGIAPTVALPGGTPQRASEPPRPAPLTLSGAEQAQAGQPITVTVQGPAGRVRFWRVDGEARDRAEPPAPGGEGATRLVSTWPAPVDGDAAFVEAPQPVAELVLVEGEPATVTLDPAVVGTVQLWALHAAADVPEVATQITVVQPDRLHLDDLPPQAVAGEPLALAASETALLVLDGTRQATVGRAASFSVPYNQSSVTLSAVDVHGRSHRSSRPVRRDLEVQVQADPTTEGDGLRLRATVSLPSGAPARAQVALRVVDTRLHDAVGGAFAGGLPVMGLGRHAHAWGGPLFAVADSTAISGALLAERAREAEAARREQAAEGRLSGGRLVEMMEAEEMTLGGLGTVGRGAGGGGGYGSGKGVMGGVQGGVVGGRRALVLPPAHREQVGWWVVETDAQGAISVDLPALPPGTWRVEARAMSAQAAGRGEATVRSSQRPVLYVHELAPSGPDDRVAPLVTVENRASSAVSLELSGAPGFSTAFGLEPGAVRRVALPAARTGAAVPLSLLANGSLVEQRAVVVPAAIPSVADAEGPLVSVAWGPKGGVPVAALLQEAAGDGRAWVHAENGRIALAAGDTGAAARALFATRLTQRSGGATTAAAQAEVLVFLADVAAALPSSGVSTDELDEAARQLRSLVVDSDDRVAELWALARAGRPVEEPALGRLLRDAARLAPEVRSRLAVALVALGRVEEAAGLPAGDGPWASLARHALDLPHATGDLFVPPVGAADRATAVLARLAAAPAAGRPAAGVVRVDGVQVSASKPGAALSWSGVVAAGAQVAVSGAPGAVLRRGGTPTGDGAWLSAWSPQGPAGQPLGVPTREIDQSCGAGPQTPCLLRVGDALQVRGVQPAPGAVAGGAVSWESGRLRARAPGSSVVRGFRVTERGTTVPAAPLWVEVRPLAAEHTWAGLPPTAAVELAESALSIGDDPAPYLASRPAFDDWPAALRPRVMGVRWSARGDAAPAETVARFESLRDADPSAALPLAEVAEVAQAYAATGSLGRSLAVWRAGLGAAFLAEAAPLRRLQDAVGPLPSLQALQLLPQRYPTIPVVNEAEFHLPEQLVEAMESGRLWVGDESITETDVRLLAAAWDRRFLAFHPSSELAPQAAFHLTQGLLRLGAHAAAAEQAGRWAEAAPDAPVVDGLRYIEGLAAAELGEASRARRWYTALAERTDWPQDDGTRGPAGFRPDARYALARLDDARGRSAAAAERYREVVDAFPEAADALASLERVTLSVPERVLLTAGDSASVSLTSTNLDEVFLRAYRLDLRTVFLRDGGLGDVRSVEVSGVSPAWAGRRPVRSSAFPDKTELTLPLSGLGAWLVEISGDGVSERVLIVRSALSLDVTDGSAGRRVVVQSRGRPVAGAQVRALVQGSAEATTTDLRGVALVAAGAPVLVFAGEQVAFSEPAAAGAPRRPAPRRKPTNLLDNLDRRIEKQRQDNRMDFERTYQMEADEAVDLNAL